MKNVLLLGFILLAMNVSFASSGQQGGNGQQGGGTTVDDDFGSGSDEFEFERFSNENVLAMIEDDMELACNGTGLCTLHAVTQSDRRFTATFNVGEGSPVSGLSKPEGSVIITDGSQGLYDSQQYWGVQFEYTTGTCTQSIQVPRSLYLSMNRYFYDFIDEEGNTRRGFDPSKEAMIMFYSTIVKQASGCNAPK